MTILSAFNERSFLQLLPVCQRLLEFLSILYTPIDPQSLSHIFPEPKTPGLQTLLDQLTATGWLIRAGSFYTCPPELRDEYTLQALRGGRFEPFARAVRKHFLSSSMLQTTREAALRDLRLAILLNDSANLTMLIWRVQTQPYLADKRGEHPIVSLWGDPFNEAWLSFFSPPVLLQYIAPVYLSRTENSLNSAEVLWARCLPLLSSPDALKVWPVQAELYYIQLFLRGNWDNPVVDKAPILFSKQHIWHLFAAARALSQGNSKDAIAQFQVGLKAFRKGESSKNSFFRNIFETLYVLALVLDGGAMRLKQAGTYIQELCGSQPAYQPLGVFAGWQDSGNAVAMPDDSILEHADIYSPLFAIMVRHWLGQPIPKSWVSAAIGLCDIAERAGFRWLAGEYAAAILHILPGKSDGASRLALLSKDICAQLGNRPLIDLNCPRPAWEGSILALQRLGEKRSPAASSGQKKTGERLVWLLTKEPGYYKNTTLYTITPEIQKYTKTGWASGRKLTARLLEKDSELKLSEEDLRICHAIQTLDYVKLSDRHEIGHSGLWPLLIGHPRVFWEDAPASPIDIQQGQAELQIAKTQEELRIKLFPELPPDQYSGKNDCVVVEESTLQLRVYKLTADFMQFQKIVGRGLTVPQSAEASLSKALEAIAPMITIHSDISGLDKTEEVQVDSRIQVHMLPHGPGLRLLQRVRPFTDKGPLFTPGNGRNTVIADLDGKSMKTLRNFKEELDQAKALLVDCLALSSWEDLGDDLLLLEPEQCLEALEQLHALGNKITLCWPEGEKLRITPTIGASSLSLKIKRSKDWFEIDGNLWIDENLVLSLRQLLELSRNAMGRFIPLESGQYLTLTSQFQKKIEALRAYAEDNKAGIRVGTLAALALEDLVAEAGDVESDKDWKAQVNKVKRVRNSHPTVPSSLQAELRDYQEEGFRWMMRLAEWGVGACLADDMGLGKTVQALAVLLSRGHKGAALVVAPTSVCNNWYTECQKFAPDLRPIFYRGKDRQLLLEALQPKDLLIATYGLLQQDSEIFGNLKWSTVILDEAQAIKNSLAKRTQAAYQLQGDFRLITTGTPIENHLGELWSLFRFLNPGLLLSQQKFTERFWRPIEGSNDEKARQHLKKLVHPFMLRRTKNQVLQELPPRTEITLTVTLSDGEMALYDAIRQEALERLANPVEQGENKHLQVLAEITRLRLAACHPQLVMPESDLPSSKLQAFGELVTELRENQHKALVFSQFVKHLTRIRAWLDTEKIPYQYLDGSTPPEQRQERVEAFQAGKGDIFLISLKAGGFGLNLTAADYVIHMDPWWNPAVEDQASDRAHRIGQHRPVTVYRLVAENTIEEKIVKLHQQKRDLADSLLEGSDMSGKLSARDMLDMIRTGI